MSSLYRSNATEPNLKALDWMMLLLSRLNDSQLSDNFSMSNSEEEEDLENLDDFDNEKELEKEDDKVLKLIQKIYDELFEDKSCIINFVKMLNVSKLTFLYQTTDIIILFVVSLYFSYFNNQIVYWWNLFWHLK